MKLYFLRHGPAEAMGGGVHDADRDLTPEGEALVREEAAALARMDLRLDAILTSPFLRARKTAEIVASALGAQDRLAVDERLAYGFRLGALQAMVAERPGIRALMVVGHNPDLPITAGRLAGGALIDMKRGGLILIDADRIEPGAGALEWVLPPKLLAG